MRIAIFGLLTILLFATASLVSSEDPQDIADNYGATALPITDICKYAVGQIRQKIINKAQKNPKTAAIWTFWTCLNDTELLQDAYAACDIAGDLFNNFFPPHLQEGKDYFIEKQTLAACGLCDKAADYIQGFSDEEISSLVASIETRVRDPNLAERVHEHGHAVLRHGLEVLYPHEACSDLALQCEAIGRPKIPKKLVAFMKEILLNVSHCAECNLCEIGVLFAQSHILPNPNLPGCLEDLAINSVCKFFNRTLPGIGNGGYDLCVELIDTFTPDIINAMWTFMDAGLVCGSVLKVCTPQYSDNILECICDNVKVPSWANWALPCHWKNNV